MPYISYNATGLITSDCVFVKRGTHIGTRGHVVHIYDDSVDILVKNSDGVIINIEKDAIVLRQRMFFRRKDIRGAEKDLDKKFMEEFKRLNVENSMGGVRGETLADIFAELLLE